MRVVKMKIKIITLLLGALLFVTVLPSPSLAIPAFARKYNLSCTSCHTKPPRLNSFGDAFHMSGFQIPMVREGEIKGKRRIGRIMSETDLLDILAIRTTGDFLRSFSGGTKEETNIVLLDLSIYLAGTVTDGISYFFELENEAMKIEGISGGRFETGAGLGLGKEFFVMFDLPALLNDSGMAGRPKGMHHRAGGMLHGPMVMVGKIDPSTNFSYPTNRQLIPNLPGRVSSDGKMERFGLTPYAFASKFFGVMTADSESVEVTQPVLYNTTGDLGVDLHAMIGSVMIQAGLMQGLGAGPTDSDQKKDPYLMGRVNFGGTDDLSGSLSGLVYRGFDTARVPTGADGTASVDWLRYGISGNIRRRFLDLYGAFIWDALKGVPRTAGFEDSASGLTVEGDYLATDRMLLSLRYDHLNSGGVAVQKVDGRVITAQTRYYMRDNFSFYLRDSYNVDSASYNGLRNFKNLIAFGLDFDL